jgi:hypothetical protein
VVKLQIIEASGSYYDVGFAVGKATKTQILHLLKKTPRTRSTAKKYLDNFPLYYKYVQPFTDAINYLKGMAKAVDVSYLRLIKLNLSEMDRKVDDKCTTIVLKKEDSFLIGHNEDSSSHFDGMFLLKATLPNIKLFTFCYFGSLPGFSFTKNSFGLTISNNSLNANDKQLGVAKRFVLFLLCHVSSVEDAKELLKNMRRSSGQNYIFHKGDIIVAAEASATKISFLNIKKKYFHCNNYLFSEMLMFEGKLPSPRGTFIRSADAKLTLSSINSKEDLIRILSSHNHRPSCFCAHKELGDFNNTLGTIIFDGVNFFVAYGNPCQNSFQKLIPHFA